MKLALFYDTETTGFPSSKELDHPDQPHLVQIAAHVVDVDSRKVINSIDLTVKPDGWDIPEKASDIHGITTELASAVGVSERFAIAAFLELFDMSEFRVGHSEGFDAKIIGIAIMRELGKGYSDQWLSEKSECTMKLATPIVKAVNKNGAAKNANLSEAYKHFTGKDLENAHSAIADVNACVDVYFASKGGC